MTAQTVVQSQLPETVEAPKRTLDCSSDVLHGKLGLDDGTGFLLDMTLDFRHSTGSIQGTCRMLATTLNCAGISFDPVAKTVRFELFDLGIRLEGTLDAAERRIQGRWFVIGVPVTVATWDVQLR